MEGAGRVLRSSGRGKMEPPPPPADAPHSGSAETGANLSSRQRLSIPIKPGASPRRSESLGKFYAPTSEASMSAARGKLSSVSYWMAQIRLAEVASKHSVSLGFFKLALESECEPLDRMREELVDYVARHGLEIEFKHPVEYILHVYDNKLKFSVGSSQETKKSDKADLSAINVNPKRKLKRRSRNSEPSQETKKSDKDDLSVVNVNPKRKLKRRSPPDSVATQDKDGNENIQKKRAQRQAAKDSYGF